MMPDVADVTLPSSRRRAALLHGAAGDRTPGAAAPQLTLADVERLRAHDCANARAEIAAKFGRQYDRLREGTTLALANAVLELLVKDVAKEVRQALAETVAASRNLPPAAASVLARDDIDVARPILEHSPVLGDEELVEIVRTHAMQYALAVAGRERLSERLSDALAETGSAEVAKKLVSNTGALLSARTIRRIAEDFKDARDVQDRLVRRPALPYEIVDQLVADIGRRLEWELVRTRRMSAADAHGLMRAAREKATLGIMEREHREYSAERELRQRLADGALGPEEILGYLRDGEVRYVEAGLALLAGVDVAKARAMLYNTDRRKMAALCIRAGFPTAHYASLRMALELAETGVANRGRETCYKPETMRFIQQQYEELRLNRTLVASLSSS